MTANADLPSVGLQHAETWLDLVLNGGKRGLDRALGEVTVSRHAGAIALGRALSQQQLQRPLPPSRRTNLDLLRLACGRQLAGYARTASRPELARAVGEILLASVRQPKVATELVTTVQDVLISGGIHLPVVVIFGATGTTLLPGPAEPMAVRSPSTR